jgi:hypothetical protein
VGVALAILRRQPLWLLLATWYVRSVWPDARWQVHGPRARARRFAQLAYGDAVGFTWLVRGSARHRRAVL